MKISIASDHAGFEQKQQMVEYLKAQGYEVLDRGPETDERVDYPDYAVKVAMDVSFKHQGTDFGILICGTGIGMSIFANKIVRVRAANVTIPEFAELARAHNDANVLCLSGRFIDFGTNTKIVDTFLTTEFEGGRHAARLAKLLPLERTGA
ncbi:MAG: ribose 5-phosphate isomerase B [Coriobacteriaceae bacterium]|nr:ribose 5-phosphate isomerase B [Coriobacteriaceae bacterium]